jgi:hypothetical protein
MTIYIPREDYRKIYETHYGPIPKDKDGRRYDIHHIDGDYTNNDISNLKAVSVQEHYDIHYSQGDFGACFAIAKRLSLAPNELSEIVGRASRERVRNGTHHFLDSDWQKERTKKQIANGRHPFVRREDGTSLASDRKKDPSYKNPFTGGKIQSESNQRRLENGTHHLLGSSSNEALLAAGKHPSQKQWTCEHCGVTGMGGGNYKRHHGDRCKHKT